MSVVILNLKIANVGSIANMIKRIGGNAIVSSDKKDIANATKLIFPGVGSFDTAMNEIQKSGLQDLLNEKVLHEKTPILGICLGMHVFMEKSEEGQLPGLGWVKGEVKRFKPTDPSIKIPHMGWNTFTIQKPHYLLQNLPEEFRFYFVHCYYVACDEREDQLATTVYDHPFVSAIQKENIMAVQFHPEKSHRFGKLLMKNFVELS